MSDKGATPKKDKKEKKRKRESESEAERPKKRKKTEDKDQTGTKDKSRKDKTEAVKKDKAKDRKDKEKAKDKKSKTPKKDKETPKKDKETPKGKASKDHTPKKDKTPKKKEATPKEKEATPKEKEATPKEKEASTPTEKATKDQTPKKSNEKLKANEFNRTPNHQRSPRYQYQTPVKSTPFKIPLTPGRAKILSSPHPDANLTKLSLNVKENPTKGKALVVDFPQGVPQAVEGGDIELFQEEKGVSLDIKTNAISLHGTQSETNASYFLGIVNRKTGRIELIPTDFFHLRQKVCESHEKPMDLPLSNSAKEAPTSPKEYKEWKTQNLTEFRQAFGGGRVGKNYQAQLALSLDKTAASGHSSLEKNELAALPPKKKAQEKKKPQPKPNKEPNK